MEALNCIFLMAEGFLVGPQVYGIRLNLIVVLLQYSKITFSVNLIKRGVFLIIPNVKKIHDSLEFNIIFFLRHTNSLLTFLQFIVQYYSLFIFDVNIFDFQTKQLSSYFLINHFFLSFFVIVQNSLILMSNGSKTQQSQNVKRNFVVDYRNGKYQGQILQYERIPNGKGMLLSVEYQVIIANWRCGYVDGQCVIFYPNGNIFYGTIINQEVVGLSVFYFSKLKTIYHFAGQEEFNLVVLDCQLKQTLTLARIKKAQVQKQMKIPRNKEFQWVINSLDRLKQKNLQVLDIQSYVKDSEKYQIIEKISGSKIAPEYQGYKNFIKGHFNSKIKNKFKKVEIIPANTYTQIRFKKAGLVVRVGNEKHKTHNKVKLIGYYDHYEQKCDIFMKNKSGFQPEVQEYCDGQSLTYEDQRPAMCERNLLNYFRKSTNFVNQMIHLKTFQKVQVFYQLILSLLDEELSMKNAQLQLQLGPIEEINQQGNENRHKMSHQSSYQHLQLIDVKNDIYSKVQNKRKTTADHTFSPLKSISQSRFQNQTNKSRYQYNNREVQYEPKSKIYKQYLDDPSERKAKQYLKYTESSPNLGNKSRNSKKVDTHYQNSKYSYLHNQGSEYQYSNEKPYQRNRSHLQLDLDRLKKNNRHLEKQNKRVHHEKPYEDSHFLNDSIGTLTHNYERINRELSKNKYSNHKRKKRAGGNPSLEGTPTSRSPSKYQYFKSPINSPSGASNRGKRQWR